MLKYIQTSERMVGKLAGDVLGQFTVLVRLFVLVRSESLETKNATVF